MSVKCKESEGKQVTEIVEEKLKVFLPPRLRGTLGQKEE